MLGQDGQLLTERHKLWQQDSLKCIHKLIGNPAFKEEYMSYVPKMAYMDEAAQNQMYDEMWTGDWWQETQVSRHPQQRSETAKLTSINQE